MFRPAAALLALTTITVVVLAEPAPTPTSSDTPTAARFITRLRAGEPQHIVIYGTSLSKSGAWVPQLKEALDARFPGLVTLTNSARGGQHSGWGATNVDQAVIALKPDVVFIEFAINDAVTRFGLSLDTAQRNLDTILDRITTALPQCEIVLQITNPAFFKAEGDSSHRRDQDAYQQIYRATAARRGLLLIDHSVAWRKLHAREGDAALKKLIPDGVHPNAEGWKRVVVPTLLHGIGVSAP